MKKLLIVAAIGMSLAACSDRSTDFAQTVAQPQAAAPVAQQGAAPAGAPQTVVVQAPPQQGSGVGDMLTGAALGAMAMNIFNGGGSVRHYDGPGERVVERRTVINNHYVERPKAAVQTPQAAPATQAPTYASAYATKPAAPAQKAPSYASAYSSKPASPSSSSSYSSRSSSSYGSSYSSSRSSSFSSGRR